VLAQGKERTVRASLSLDNLNYNGLHFYEEVVLGFPLPFVLAPQSKPEPDGLRVFYGFAVFCVLAPRFPVAVDVERTRVRQLGQGLNGSGADEVKQLIRQGFVMSTRQ
jgi:hypothetical protein